MAITQQEFEHLMAQEKVFDEPDEPLVLTPAPTQWSRELNAPASKEKFILDFYRGALEFAKYTYNKRYRQTIILLRFDNCGRHTNPDGVRFDGPHVHLYREGYNDKFAFPVADVGIDSGDGMDVVLTKLLRYCNVSHIPIIDPGLF